MQWYGTVGVPTARQKLGLLGRHARWSAQIAIFKSHTLLRPRSARLQKCMPTFLGRAALAIAAFTRQLLVITCDPRKSHRASTRPPTIPSLLLRIATLLWRACEMLLHGVFFTRVRLYFPCGSSLRVGAFPPCRLHQ